ncbi:MAG: YgfZ/GcvT domain-containing protein [Rhodoluna sp.]
MTQSFSNPLVEQREFLAGKSLIELEKSILKISGADRLTWLNDLFSQKLDDLVPGVSVEALWLDPQGHIVRDFHLIDDSESTWLITYTSGFDQLLNQLSRMVFRAKVVIEDVTDQYKVLASWDLSIPSGIHTWSDPWPETTNGGYRYGNQPDGSWKYRENIVSVDEVAGLWNTFTKAGTMALDALRVEAHRPAGPNEIDEKALPHEFDWLATAVHLNKGCYRGQEAVAKVHNLGHPPRRLVFLHLDGSGHALPDLGDEVYLGDVVVGKITTVGQHYEMGPIALAVIKRNTAVDELLTISCAASGEKLSAHQEVIVPASAGAVIDLGEFRAKRGKD